MAFYGPTNAIATKLAVGVIEVEGGAATHLERWVRDDGDIRKNAEVLGKAAEFMRTHGVRSVAMTEQIIGCPHVRA